MDRNGVGGKPKRRANETKQQHHAAISCQDKLTRYAPSPNYAPPFEFWLGLRRRQAFSFELGRGWATPACLRSSRGEVCGLKGRVRLLGPHARSLM